MLLTMKEKNRIEIIQGVMDEKIEVGRFLPRGNNLLKAWANRRQEKPQEDKERDSPKDCVLSSRKAERYQRYPIDGAIAFASVDRFEFKSVRCFDNFTWSTQSLNSSFCFGRLVDLLLSMG